MWGDKMRKQLPLQIYSCLDTELIGGYPPTTYNNQIIRDDSVCEVMNTVTFEIYNMYKFNNGHWYEYVVGEEGYFQSEYQEFVGFPDSPLLLADYPAQIIVQTGGIPSLWHSKSPVVYNWGSPIAKLTTYPNTQEIVQAYILQDGAWVFSGAVIMSIDIPTFAVLKSNHNIYNITSGALWFSKEV